MTPSADAIDFVSAYAEIVDLRVPDPDWVRLQSQGEHPFLEGEPSSTAPLHARRKTARAAERWLRMVRDTGVLSLRDPLRAADPVRAKPCNFSLGPTSVLRCSGHAPSRWKALPVGGAWDTCGRPSAPELDDLESGMGDAHRTRCGAGGRCVFVLCAVPMRRATAVRTCTTVGSTHSPLP
eukprot:836323-Prymnesium_polylepis.1